MFLEAIDKLLEWAKSQLDFSKIAGSNMEVFIGDWIMECFKI